MGGGVTILRHLAADLTRDHDVTVASFDAPAPGMAATQVTLRRPKPPGRAWRVAPLHRARALARSVPPDLLSDAETVVALDCHFALALRRWRPRGLVYLSLSCIARQEWFAASGMRRVLNAGQYAWLENRIGQSAEAVIAASPMHAADLRRYARITRPVTVLSPMFPGLPLGVPDAARPVTILCAGRLEPGKNIAAAIDLAHRLRDLPIRWIIAGDGPLAPLLQAQAAGLGDRVEFVGRLPDLAPVLARADIFLHPSYYESFGIVVIEAMRAGLPVLCGARVGAAPLIKGGGQVTDFAQPDAVAAQLRALIADTALRARMGRTGQDLAATLLLNDYCKGFRAVLAALA